MEIRNSTNDNCRFYKDKEYLVLSDNLKFSKLLKIVKKSVNKDLNHDVLLPDKIDSILLDKYPNGLFILTFVINFISSCNIKFTTNNKNLYNLYCKFSIISKIIDNHTKEELLEYMNYN